MDVTSYAEWHALLQDPTGQRKVKPRTTGITMVIDKGLGLHAFEDMLQTSSHHIDLVKVGFGTTPLYPQKILQKKIELAKAYDVQILPGGTFLEIAVRQNTIDAFFDMIEIIGFNGVEVSDGTIDLPRNVRTQLIERGLDAGLTVYTEYGKKCWGSTIEVEQFIETMEIDLECGAAMVTVEGRESGIGVGIFDENGNCREKELSEMLKYVTNPNLLMWEAPQKSQQVYLLHVLGTNINLGNIAPHDIMSVESLRRGLRSDTLFLGKPASFQKI